MVSIWIPPAGGKNSGGCQREAPGVGAGSAGGAPATRGGCWGCPGGVGADPMLVPAGVLPLQDRACLDFRAWEVSSPPFPALRVQAVGFIPEITKRREISHPSPALFPIAALLPRSPAPQHHSASQSPSGFLGGPRTARSPAGHPVAAGRSPQHTRELLTSQNRAVYELDERNKAEAAVATASFMGFFSPAPLKFYGPDIKT